MERIQLGDVLRCRFAFLRLIGLLYNHWDIAYGIAVSNNYVYVATLSSDLRIINISDQANPFEVGYYDTPGCAYGVSVSGDYAYVADQLYFEIFDCSAAFSGPVAVTITPLNPPIVIPEIGGAFDFNIELGNNTSITQIADVWTVIHLPNAGEMEILNVPNITINSGSFINVDRTQQVPSYAPGGVYTYYAYIGDYPWIVLDYNFFIFEKEGFDGGFWGEASDWLCTGEPFAGETIASNIPQNYALHAPFPNPFNPSTVISFELRDASEVSLNSI